VSNFFKQLPLPTGLEVSFESLGLKVKKITGLPEHMRSNGQKNWKIQNSLDAAHKLASGLRR
jgi:hypothetical protein